MSETGFPSVCSLVSKIQIIILYILSIVFEAPGSACSNNLKTFIYPLGKEGAGETMKCKKSAYTNQSQLERIRGFS